MCWTPFCNPRCAADPERRPVCRACRGRTPRRWRGRRDRAARGHHDDPVRGGGEEVFARAAVLEISRQRLARRLEIDERVAQFLKLGPQRAGRLRDHDQRLDAGIALGFVDLVDRPSQRERPLDELAEHVVRLDFAERRVDAQIERRVRGDRRRRAHEQPDDNQAAQRHHNREDDQDDNEEDAAAGRHSTRQYSVRVFTGERRSGRTGAP